MYEIVNLMDPDVEPTDQQLERLVKSATADAMRRALKAKQEYDELLRAQVNEALDTFQDYIKHRPSPQ